MPNPGIGMSAATVQEPQGVMGMQDWVFLFPGQGSQYVGMGQEFYESYSEVRELFAQASEILQMDVARLCFQGRRKFWCSPRMFNRPLRW